MSGSACEVERRRVPLEELVLDERCQMRDKPSREVIKEYAEAYREGRELPPLDVVEVDDVGLVVTDGFHRFGGLVEAHQAFARIVVIARGTMNDAVWHACAANAQHGLRRSNEDKRKAVWAALSNPIGQEQANTVIADHCGVSEGMVRKLRKEWEAGQPRTVRGSTGEACDSASQPTKRKGRDGKERRPPKREATRYVPEPDAMHGAGDGFGGTDDPAGEDVRTWTPEEDPEGPPEARGTRASGGPDAVAPEPDAKPETPSVADFIAATNRYLEQARTALRSARIEVASLARQTKSNYARPELERVANDAKALEAGLGMAQLVECPKHTPDTEGGCKRCLGNGFVRQGASR